jgi:tight adherence protein B
LRCVLVFALIVSITSGLLHKPLLLGIFGGIIFSFWLPLKVLKFKTGRRLKRFLRLFPDGIDLIVRGLRSGLPVSESIKLVAQEVEDPVGHTFEMIASTMKLGVPLEKALQEMAIKLDCTEFNFFTTSIVLQRETGGNLAEILGNLSDVLRKRFMMRMKIKAMSSEARASAVIVGSLPFIVFIALLVISPGYTDPLFRDGRGNICLGVAIGMLCTGVWSMNRMARFEI